MADETKKRNNANQKPATEQAASEKKEKTFTASEVEKMIAKAVATALADVQQANQTVVVKETSEPLVTLLYMGTVAEGSTVSLGKLGDIQGRGGTRDIPKKEFFQNLNPAILKRLKDRRLIVLSGLTDDERERYGVKYTDGELLSSDVYYKLLSLDETDIINIFKKACYRHKQIISTLYIDAYMKGDNRVNQPFIQKLNEISKADDKDGMFKGILKDMIAEMNDATDGE